MLSTRRGQEQSIGLDVQPWVEQTSARMVKRLRTSGVRLLGDWADLTPELVAAARHGFDGLRAILERRHCGLPQWPDPTDSAGAVDALARLVCAGASREAPA